MSQSLPSPSSPALPNVPQPWWQSFGFAFQGLRWVWHTQRNFRIHGVIALLVLLTAGLLSLARWEWLILIIMMTGMLVIECLNTAIEAVTDLICGQTLHPLAKIAKDVAAAACLLWALGSVIVGLILMGPHFWAIGNKFVTN